MSIKIANYKSIPDERRSTAGLLSVSRQSGTEHSGLFAERPSHITPVNPRLRWLPSFDDIL